MKYNLLAFSLLLVSLGLTACGSDNNSNEPIVNPVPNPPAEITVVKLNGMITDSFGAPLEGVTLQIGDQTIVTDNTGTYTLSIDSLDDKRAIVLIKKAGYLTTARELHLTKGNIYKLDIALTKNQIETLFETSTGITQPIDAGAAVTIPANSIVNNDGRDYVGAVNIAANYYNPDSVAGANAFAQPYVGVDEHGENETPLVTVGVIDVKMTDANGNELDLKDGATATLTFPEASTDQDLPTIPLWYYDEANMIWVKDGVATRQPDGSYQGQVSHFTLWNLDIPLYQGSALVEGCFINKDTSLPVASDINAVIKGRGFVNSGGVDNEGKFSAQVPINTPLTLASYYSDDKFDSVEIPALEQNTVYKVNDGVCLLAQDTRTDDMFSYVDVFTELPAPPTSTTQNPSSDVITGIIGYGFDLDIDDPEDELRLVDVEMTTIVGNNNNTTTSTLQSLYKKLTYNDVPSTDLYNLTEQGISTARTLLEPQNDTLTVISYGQSYTANSATQRLPNGFVSKANFETQSLSGQKIGDALVTGADVYYDDIGDDIINKFNGLPNSLNTFGADATCLKLIDDMVNQDYIESLWTLPNLSFDDAVAGFGSDASTYNRGTWAGIPWIADVQDPTDDDEPIAYFKYAGTVYGAIYYSAARYWLDDGEEDICGIYNEAAKAQILAALEAAYPAL